MAQGSEQETAAVLAGAEEACSNGSKNGMTSINSFGTTAKAEVQQSRIQHLEQALQRIQQRIEKLEQEKSDLTAGPVERN